MKRFDKKLVLNKMTVTQLEDNQMQEVKGGSYVWTCQPCDTMWNSCIRCEIETQIC